jgi:hypothetical protein
LEKSEENPLSWSLPTWTAMVASVQIAAF